MLSLTVLTSFKVIARLDYRYILIKCKNQGKQFTVQIICIRLFKLLTKVLLNNFTNTEDTKRHGLPYCILSATISSVINIQLSLIIF